jgi:hypothetical protein
MKYQRPAFTVPANTAKVDPEKCLHTWVNLKKQECVLCGAHVPYRSMLVPDGPEAA